MSTTLERPTPPADGPAPRPRKPVRRWRLRFVPIACLLLGTLLMLYPVVATYYNNYWQTDFARQYDAQVGSAKPAALDKELAAARVYNDRLSPKLLHDPWAAGPSESTKTYRAYLRELDLFDAMARLRIPSIDVDLPVYHGTSENTLARGVGHIYGSSLPVGGKGTHAALTAHSSFAQATLFDNLHKLSAGDTFYVDVYGRTLAYRVDKIQVVLPEEIDKLAPDATHDYVTLVTCTPYAINSHRLLVRAVRVPYSATADPASTRQPFMDWTPQAWMYPRLAASAVALLALLIMLVRWVRADRSRARRARAAAARAAAAEIPADAPEIPADAPGDGAGDACAAGAGDPTTGEAEHRAPPY